MQKKGKNSKRVKNAKKRQKWQKPIFCFAFIPPFSTSKFMQKKKTIEKILQKMQKRSKIIFKKKMQQIAELSNIYYIPVRRRLYLLGNISFRQETALLKSAFSSSSSFFALSSKK